MNNEEKIKVINHHYNNENCPCMLKSSGEFKVYDQSRMPKDVAELEQWASEMGADIASKQYIEDRKKAYQSAGLTFEHWNEINIEGDQAKIDKYVSDRDQIRLEIPNPNL